MSFTLPLLELSSSQQKQIKTQTEISPDATFGGKVETQSEFCFKRPTEDLVSLPLGMFESLGLTPSFDNERFGKFTKTFHGTLTDQQENIVNFALEQLFSKHTCFLDLPTATGKTCISIAVAAKLGLETAFLCHLDAVNRQTVGEFAKFSDLKVELVKKNRLDPDANVHIMGLRKAHNLWSKNRNIFDKIGLVILDETHLCSHFTFMEVAFCFHPKYLLGMSATPIWNTLTSLYFGDPITIFKTKPFTVKKISTRFSPDTSKKIYFNGKWRLDWTNAMTSLAENEQRNIFILELIQKYIHHKLLVICGRVSQCEWLYKNLVDKNIDTDILVGRKKSYKQGVNVLVGGVKKIGVGFNDPTRTALVLCFDLSDVRQCEGRIRTTDNLILDLVDNNYTLEQHWKKRMKWYTQRGAKIKLGHDEKQDVSSRNTQGEPDFFKVLFPGH
jgi:hypothetical protein